MSGVVVAGGGVGGIEAVLAVRGHLGRDVPVTLVTASPHFVYRPWSVGEPFGRGKAVAVDLEGLAADQGVELVVAELEEVDGEGHAVLTGAGSRDYDHLVLSLGARQVEVVKGAWTFRGPDNAAELGDYLDVDDAAIAFVTTASAVWPLPAYELALLTAARGRGNTVMLVTAEPSALAAFGPEASADVTQVLRDQGVELLTEAIPDHFDGERLSFPMAGALQVDRVVALPGLLGRTVAGVPHDGGGFVSVDEYGRVEGLDDVFAVGDMTARPLKQGGLAAQQADVAAGTIAAAAGVEPYAPVLRAMLLTGDGPRYLRHPTVPGVTPETATEAPWWPAHKIAGRHLGPYLAAHGELVFTP